MGCGASQRQLGKIQSTDTSLDSPLGGGLPKPLTCGEAALELDAALGLEGGGPKEGGGGGADRRGPEGA